MAAFDIRPSRRLYEEAGHRTPISVRTWTDPSSSYRPRLTSVPRQTVRFIGWPKPPAPADLFIPPMSNARSEQEKRKKRYPILLFHRETRTRFCSVPSLAASKSTKSVRVTRLPRPNKSLGESAQPITSALISRQRRVALQGRLAVLHKFGRDRSKADIQRATAAGRSVKNDPKPTWDPIKIPQRNTLPP